MKNVIKKRIVILSILITSISNIGCNINTTQVNNINNIQNEKKEEEIINQKLKSIPEENQINVLEDNVSQENKIIQKITEIYIPNYEENYLIAKTISLEVEQGSYGEYIDSDKVLNYLKQEGIMPKELETISIGKQISDNSSCLIVNFPKKVYSLFDNYEDEKLFLEAILKSLLNIYDTQEISISTDFQKYASNFIVIDEFKYYR